MIFVNVTVIEPASDVPSNDLWINPLMVVSLESKDVGDPAVTYTKVTLAVPPFVVYLETDLATIKPILESASTTVSP